MSKDYKPKHEIAMAIHHISKSQDIIIKWDNSPNKSRDGSHFGMPEEVWMEIVGEQKLAHIWLNQAQDKLNGR